MGRALSALPLFLAACTMINPDYDEVEVGGDGSTSSETGPDGQNGAPGSDDSTSVGGDADGGMGSEGGDESGPVDPTGDGDPGSGQPPSWSFGSVEPVDELNSDAADDDPTLRSDLLEIYFASRRTGRQTIYASHRRTIDDPWDEPVQMDFGMGPADETSPELSSDGLTLTFGRNTSRVPNSHDIWIVTRPSVDDDWITPVSFSALNNSGFASAAVFVDDPLDLLLCAERRDTLGFTDLYRVGADSIDGTAAFERLDALSSEGTDCDVFVEPSGNVVTFATDRAGHWDLWRATKDGASWGDVQAIPDLNTDGDDSDPWLSPPTGIMYFARDEGSGYDIYRAVAMPD